MQYTVNLNLKKPELTDYVDIRHINDNFDSLDTIVNNKVDKIAGKGLSTEDYTTTEKTKLSGIETGATADQTASEILTLIKTVDGASSGLDADTLDGVHASGFAISTHAHTTFDRASAVLSGANVFSNIVVTDGITTDIATRALTKSDLSLGSVMNYGIATQAEAEAGSSDVKYMTPLKTKQSIDKLTRRYETVRSATNNVVYETTPIYQDLTEYTQGGTSGSWINFTPTFAFVIKRPYLSFTFTARFSSSSYSGNFRVIDVSTGGVLYTSSEIFGTSNNALGGNTIYVGDKLGQTMTLRVQLNYRNTGYYLNMRVFQSAVVEVIV